MASKPQKQDAPQPEEPKNLPANVSTMVSSSNIAKLSEAEMKEMAGVEGAGLSDSVEDRGTPLLYIAQKGSPQVDERDAKYLQGLKPGMAFNNLTGEMFDAEKEGVPFLPCFMRVAWTEWTPRDSGGGFHGEHPRNVDMNRLRAKPWSHPKKPDKVRRDIFVLPNGHELKLTHKYYGIIVPTWSPIIVPMASTSLGCSTRIQGLIQAQKVAAGNRIVTKPGVWNIFNLKTTYEKNDDGNWFQWSASIQGPNDNVGLREAAKQFAILCAQGTVKEASPTEDVAVGGAPDDKDIPI